MADKLPDDFIQKINDALQSGRCSSGFKSAFERERSIEKNEEKQPINQLVKKINQILEKGGYGRLNSISFELYMCSEDVIRYDRQLL